MSEYQAIADRSELEALCGEFTDAGMMRGYDRFVSLFTRDREGPPTRGRRSAAYGVDDELRVGCIEWSLLPLGA
jgi:hypothetical protein